MFSYSTGYYVSLPDDQYLKFKNRCSLMRSEACFRKKTKSLLFVDFNRSIVFPDPNPGR
jgi:hypothetical protein